MEENDVERRKAMQEYYQIYGKLQKRYGLREHSRFDVYGNNIIEIWECMGGRKVRLVCKAKEKSETACYRSAIEDLKYIYKVV